MMKNLLFLLIFLICTTVSLVAQPYEEQIVPRPYHDEYLPKNKVISNAPLLLTPNRIFQSKKSLKSTIYVPDTIIYYQGDTTRIKNIVSYSQSGKALNVLQEKITNNILINYRFTYVYDASDKLVSYVMEIYKNKAWENYYRGFYTYDSNGYEVSEFSEIWTNNSWIYSYRYTFTYDTNGNMLTELYEYWYNNSWVNYFRYTNTYDTNNNVLTFLYENWTNNAWVNYYRNTYTYDANKNMLTDLYEYWLTNSWIKYSRDTYTYDANNRFLTYSGEIYTNNVWVITYRGTYTYDSNSYLLSAFFEVLTNKVATNYSKYEYTVDANGYRTKAAYYLWNATSGKWQLTTNVNLWLYYSYYFAAKVEAHYIPMIITEMSQEIEKNQISIYPNPTDNILRAVNLDFPAVTFIYNSTGKLLHSNKVNYSSSEIDVSQLPCGAYIFKIQSGTKIINKPFIIAR